MVSYGLFHHVTHSHIFSDDKLLYRFSVEIDPLAIDSTAVDEVFLRGDAEATKLMDTLRKGNQELKATRSALSITQVKYDDLLELWESASLNFDELQQSMRYVDYSFMAAQVLILLVVVAYYYFDNSNLVNALLTVAIALAIHVNVILGRGFGIFFSLKTSRPHENIALPALAESPEYTSDNEFEGEGDGVEGDLSFDNYEYDTEDDDEAMGDLDADDPSTPNAVGWQGMATGSGSVLGANSYPSTRRSRGYSWSGGNLSSDQGLAMAEKLSNNPILVRRCPRMLRSDLGEEQRAALSQPLPIHTVDPNHAIIDIDSDLFVGKAYMVVADVPGAPAAFFRWVDLQYRDLLAVRVRISLEMWNCQWTARRVSYGSLKSCPLCCVRISMQRQAPKIRSGDPREIQATHSFLIGVHGPGLRRAAAPTRQPVVRRPRLPSDLVHSATRQSRVS